MSSLSLLWAGPRSLLVLSSPITGTTSCPRRESWAVLWCLWICVWYDLKLLNVWQQPWSVHWMLKELASAWVTLMLRRSFGMLANGGLTHRGHAKLAIKRPCQRIAPCTNWPITSARAFSCGNWPITSARAFNSCTSSTSTSRCDCEVFIWRLCSCACYWKCLVDKNLQSLRQMNSNSFWISSWTSALRR